MSPQRRFADLVVASHHLKKNSSTFSSYIENICNYKSSCSSVVFYFNFCYFINSVSKNIFYINNGSCSSSSNKDCNSSNVQKRKSCLCSKNNIVRTWNT